MSALSGAVRTEVTQGVPEMRHEVLLSTMPQVATRGPPGVAMQTDWPSSKSRPWARQVQSAAASETGIPAANAAIATMAFDPLDTNSS